MLYYFDSSAVVKRYAPERGSGWIGAIVETTQNTVYLNQIGVVEVAAALAKKIRTRELTVEGYEAALWLFLTDLANREYAVVPLSDQVVELGVELTRRHPLRGYDAVHLATAATMRTALLGAGLPPLVFVSADQVLCEAAENEGLLPVNPNEH
ncbi:MAG: hypothetical protein QG637_1266 [Chloroflexota bacterium]|nr:hypothetical protein [Chloroflexota bacterium]